MIIAGNEYSSSTPKRSYISETDDILKVATLEFNLTVKTINKNILIISYLIICSNYFGFRYSVHLS